MHLVSVIIPTYNSYGTISDTLDSVCSQTYSNLEIIVVDDNSVDNTCEFVTKYISQDNRLRLLRNSKNQGAAVSRNNGIDIARGRYIAFCDADDIWLPNKVEMQLSRMAQLSTGLVCSSYLRVNVNQMEIGLVQPESLLTHRSLSKYNSVGCSTVIIDRSIVSNLKFPLLRTRQDYALWLSLTSTGMSFYCLKEPLVRYAVRSGSVSSNKILAAYVHFKVLFKFSKLNVIQKLFCYCAYLIHSITVRL